MADRAKIQQLHASMLEMKSQIGKLLLENEALVHRKGEKYKDKNKNTRNEKISGMMTL